MKVDEQIGAHQADKGETGSGLTRLSINITNDTANQLRALAAESGTTVTNIVRRAVEVYRFLDEELADKGKSLQIVDKGNRSTTTIAIL